MSIKGMNWVFDHSPYTLGARLIHLAIADVANEDNDWHVWVSHSRIAAKAHVSRSTVVSTIKRMVEDGALEQIEERKGAPSIYRMIGPGVSDIEQVGCAIDDVKGARLTERDCLSTEVEQKSSRGKPRDSSKAAREIFIDEKFAEAWALYPRKLNRGGARQCFGARVKAGVAPADLIEATRNFAALCIGKEAKFIMHGSRFYGSKCEYLDYLTGDPDAEFKPATVTKPKPVTRWHVEWEQTIDSVVVDFGEISGLTFAEEQEAHRLKLLEPGKLIWNARPETILLREDEPK